MSKSNTSFSIFSLLIALLLQGCGGSKETIKSLGNNPQVSTSQTSLTAPDDREGQHQETSEDDISGISNGSLENPIDKPEAHNVTAYDHYSKPNEPINVEEEGEEQISYRKDNITGKLDNDELLSLAQGKSNKKQRGSNTSRQATFYPKNRLNQPPYNQSKNFQSGKKSSHVEPVIHLSQGIYLVKKAERSHVTKIDFQKNKDLIQRKIPHLAKLETWENIPNFVVITGKNGSGKTQLLKYIYEQLNCRCDAEPINVLFQEADYMTDTYSSDRRRDPNHYIDPNNQGSLIKHVIQYYETGKEVANLLVQKIIEQISQGKISKLPSEEDKMPGWEKEIQKFVERHKDFCLEDPDVSAPLSILRDVFAIHIDRVAALKKKYKVVHDSTLLEFYFKEKQLSLNDYNNIKAFFATMADAAFSNSLLELYIQQELELIAPWVEINRILEAHHFKYRVQIVEGNSSNKDRNFILTRNIGEGTAKISPNDLSSGERVVLRLLSQLFYFRGITADGKNPAEIKPLDVMLLDEPDRHLDPELCQQMYEIIYEEFVKKHHVQVFMTTHRLDAVFFAPDKSTYTIGEGDKLISDKESVINRMTSHIIAPVINQRSATSILSGGKLTVLEDINYVLAENEDDVKFYNIIYQKLKSGHPSAVAKKTQLIFMPVGIRLDKISEKAKSLRLTYNNINEQIKSLLGENLEIDKELASLDKQLKELASYVDQGSGSDAVKEKVNKVPIYQGSYDTCGRVINSLQKVPEKYHTLSILWGIVDNDDSMIKNATKAERQVHALNVYSFENYLCMPLNLFYYIRKCDPLAYANFKFQNDQETEKKQLQLFFEGKNLDFEQGSGTKEQLQQISNWTLQYLQQLNPLKKVCDFVVDELKKDCNQNQQQMLSTWSAQYQEEKSKSDTEYKVFKEKDNHAIGLIGDKEIEYKKVFSITKGHTLVEIISKLMPDMANEKKINGILGSFKQVLKSSKEDDEKKQKLFKLFDSLLKPDEKNTTVGLLKSLEEMPVAYLPKSLLELIERLQNSEEVKK